METLLRDDIDGRYHPNPRIVSLADVALLRAGRLEAALAEACPSYVRWRDHWREVAANPAGHRARVSQAHRRRRLAERQRRMG